MAATAHTPDPARAAPALPPGAARVLLWGDMGTGKTTLAKALGRRLAHDRGDCTVLGLDPGSPGFGPPGAVSAARWAGAGFTVRRVAALCTLDAVRFRLPLVHAATRLAAGAQAGTPGAPLLIDPPGVARGVAGAELLATLVEALEVDTVVALHRQHEPVPLAAVLAGLPVSVIPLPAAPGARRPPPRERAARRTARWRDHLRDARETRVDLSALPCCGTPPPLGAAEAWVGRQAALLDVTGATLSLGEVAAATPGGTLTLRLPPGAPGDAARLLVRDATCPAGGTLGTARGTAHGLRARLPPTSPLSPPAGPDSPPLHCRVGWVWATLLGGVFGDPLLHARLRHRRRSLLFDLGDAGRLPARLAHQVTDLFLSHAHLDHVGGFPWFLRSRLGPFFACRVFGPPGTIESIGHFLAAITWDRIGDNGAVFEVAEVHGDRLVRTRLQPGKRSRNLPEVPVAAGVIWEEPEFAVCAAVVDHGIPAVAYALTTRRELNVRKDRLRARRLPPGPWLAALKQALWRGDPEALVALPDGTRQPAGALGDDLVLARPGRRLAYVADCADTEENRARLVELARGAHTLFCEAGFAAADRARADATQHLTARAAAEIAVAAGAERLAPFHFSRRYEHDPEVLWRELRAAAGGRVALLGDPHADRPGGGDPLVHRRPVPRRPAAL